MVQCSDQSGHKSRALSLEYYGQGIIICCFSDLNNTSWHQFSLCFLLFQVFAYNAEKDRLDLCLGQRHIQVQPLDKETLLLAHTRPTQVPTDERASSLSTEASFSGAIGQRDASHTRVAFSGEGRTLSQSSQADSAKVHVSVILL